VYSRRHPGGPDRGGLPISLVLLSRGTWLFRPEVVVGYHSFGFQEILLVEEGPPRYDVEALLAQVPELRLLVPLTPSSPGMKINQAAREVWGDKFLVLWDDQTLPEVGLPTRVLRVWLDSPSVAVAPERRDSQGRLLPSVMVPGLEKDRLKILSLGTDLDSVESLFPADYVALYDRKRFLLTGGFDASLGNPFWQKVDWGLRARLWGESIQVERGFRVDYLAEPPLEDQTPDRSYPRFFLRNLAVRHVGDHGVLPFSRLWAHLRRSGQPWASSLLGFLGEKAWVDTHRYRFQTDARLLTELWGTP